MALIVMNLFKSIFLLALILRQGAAKPQLGNLGGEAFGGDAFRDARQTPIDLGTNNFLLPSELKDQSDIAQASIGKSIDSAGNPANISPLLVGFTPDKPAQSVGVPLPQGDKSAIRNLQELSVSRVGVALPQGDNINIGVNLGDALPPSFQGQGDSVNLNNFGIQISSEHNPLRTQANLDRNGNSIIGVAVNSEQNPGGIHLASLLSQGQGIPLPSSQNSGGAPTPQLDIDLSDVFPNSFRSGVPLPNSGSGNAQSGIQIAPQKGAPIDSNRNVQISSGVPLPSNRGNAGRSGSAGGSGVPLPSRVDQGQRTSNILGSGISLPSSGTEPLPRNENTGGFGSSSGSGVPIPSNSGNNLNNQFSSGVPLPGNGRILSSQNGRNINFQANSGVSIPSNSGNNLNDQFSSGVPLPGNGRILSSQDGKNINFQSDSGIPLPTIVDLSDGPPRVNQNDQALRTDGASLISSQGQNTIREFSVDQPFPSLPQIGSGNGVPLPSGRPSLSTNLDVGIPIPSGTPDILANDNTLGSLLGSLASGPGSFDLSGALAESGDSIKDIENLTIGDLLMGINGQNGIMVVPLASVSGDSSGSSLSDLSGLITDNNIGKSVQGIPPANTQIEDVDIEANPEKIDISIDLKADSSETNAVTPSPTTTAASTTTRRARRRRPSTTPAPRILRDILSEVLFSKGQWFGTLLGGLIDYGIILRDSFRENFRTRPTPSYSSPIKK